MSRTLDWGLGTRDCRRGAQVNPDSGLRRELVGQALQLAVVAAHRVPTPDDRQARQQHDHMADHREQAFLAGDDRVQRVAQIGQDHMRPDVHAVAVERVGNHRWVIGQTGLIA